MISEADHGQDSVLNSMIEPKGETFGFPVIIVTAISICLFCLVAKVKANLHIKHDKRMKFCNSLQDKDLANIALNAMYFVIPCLVRR